ncbi:hypothetical protein KOM00_06850 [Geomonas sp. Red69]|uniref:hypothetical protein n=1 Tax=Geomonas diazotrophica TaxID=2843197 RepID=UPI001C1133F6|nr:hypothetical protein [Geomonas diazotrophica]MBU5636451.1 hypothetical protein [Geomonas diazotrophica]
MKYPLPHLFFALLILAGSFFLLRLPFYAQELVGEEGIIAHLFLNEVKKPDYLLLARIDGVNQMTAPQHPAPMYQAINGVGKVVRQLVPFGKLDPLESAFVLRVVFSLPLFLVLLSGVVYLYRCGNENLYYWLALLVGFASSPVLLVSSTELQLDASFGIGSFGLWALAVTALSGSLPARLYRHGAVLFLACFAAGLGKNEWSLVLCVTLFAGVAYAWFSARSRGAGGGAVAILLLGLFGLLAGNLFSYLDDPLNYVMGWQLMSSMSKHESIFNLAKLQQLLGVMGARWTYVAQALLLILCSSFLFLRARFAGGRMERWGAGLLFLGGLYYLSTWNEMVPFNIVSFLVPLAVLVFALILIAWLADGEGKAPLSAFSLVPALFSLLLFAAYFVSTWEGGPRYYAVAQIVSLFALVSVLRVQSVSAQRKLLVCVTLSLLVLHAVSWANRGRYQRVVVHTPDRQGNCLPVLSSGEAVFKKGDFLGSSCSREYLQQMSKKYNRPLCGP